MVLSSACGEGSGGSDPASFPLIPAYSDVEFVGQATCAQCHEVAASAWTGSHHDLAIQEPVRESVLAPFDGEQFEQFGVVSTFLRDASGFVVRTLGAEGTEQEFRVAYAFGIDPLQQYLLEGPGGRLQAFETAWDTRPAEAGGQRWFALYPDEPIPAGDALHWAGVNQNWNSNCAACHSTDLVKGYSAVADSFETSWSELDVSCEACHGPGSAHVDWARSATPEPGDDPRLALRFAGPAESPWTIDRATGSAIPHPRTPEDPRIDACAACHSRRSPLTDGAHQGTPFLDAYSPSLLDASLYFPDGQIQDEVFVWGSFVQSAMFDAGVTCSDCHDPHSLELRRDGNELCAGCHVASQFDTPAHHFHPTESEGAACVSCHMPERTYMVVDPRRDHSIRIPRPDLSPVTGAPDACTGCHTDMTPEEAASEIRARYPAPRPVHWGNAIAAAHGRAPDADPGLLAVANDPEIPAIARATALSLLVAPGTEPAREALGRGMADASGLVRIGTLRAAERLEPASRVSLARLGINDPARAVRLEAARLLAVLPNSAWPSSPTQEDQSAIEEYRRMQETQAERPESHMNLAAMALAGFDTETAEGEYLRALGLQPSYGPAAINLTDLYRQMGRDEEGEALLRDATARSPQDAGLHHALGLLLFRLDRVDEGLAGLAEARELDPGEPRFAYVYAIALNSVGDSDRAVLVLEAAHAEAPADRDVLIGLATIERDRGRIAEALRYARDLFELDPTDPEALQLVRSLGGIG